MDVIGGLVGGMIGIALLAILLSSFFVWQGSRMAKIQNASFTKAVLTATSTSLVIWFISLVFSIIPIIGTILGFIIGLIIALLLTKFIYSIPAKKAISLWFYNFLAQVIAMVIGIFLFAQALFNMFMPPKEMNIEEIKNSIKIVQYDSKFIGEFLSQDEYLVIPSCRIRIKNVGKRPLDIKSVSGVFVLQQTGKIIGEGTAGNFQPAPLEKGQESSEIFLQSKTGFKSISRDSAHSNLDGIKEIQVNIYIRMKKSISAFIGAYPVKLSLE